ncbi:MAG TPA: class I SAM-dependent methyltransferase [Streptosporangiaceae bacterium]|nr:class I SAM-dependent methyltransferase [Streptosporangiaceae bacterium]
MSAALVYADRYASLEYQAIYLRAEWGDILFPDGCRAAPEPAALEPDVLIGDGRPGHFYRRTAAVTASWALSLGLDTRRCCDVGGSTGRLVHELAKRLPDARELVLAEPSAAFCTWARRLLLGEDFDRWMPVPDGVLRPTHRRVEPASLPKPVPQASVYQVSAPDVPRPEGYFDVVTCANVLDRVDDPAVLVKELRYLVRPGGLLVVSSPMHFDEHYTSRDRWIGDVREVLDPAHWSVGDRDIDVRYELYQTRRRIISYLSQVIGAVRR